VPCDVFIVSCDVFIVSCDVFIVSCDVFIVSCDVFSCRFESTLSFLLIFWTFLITRTRSHPFPQKAPWVVKVTQSDTHSKSDTQNEERAKDEL